MKGKNMTRPLCLLIFFLVISFSPASLVRADDQEKTYKGVGYV